MDGQEERAGEGVELLEASRWKGRGGSKGREQETEAKHHHRQMQGASAEAKPVRYLARGRRPGTAPAAGPAASTSRRASAKVFPLLPVWDGRHGCTSPSGQAAAVLGCTSAAHKRQKDGPSSGPTAASTLGASSAVNFAHRLDHLPVYWVAMTCDQPSRVSVPGTADDTCSCAHAPASSEVLRRRGRWQCHLHPRIHTAPFFCSRQQQRGQRISPAAVVSVRRWR
jgi:hypothetical protein